MSIEFFFVINLQESMMLGQDQTHEPWMNYHLFVCLVLNDASTLVGH